MHILLRFNWFREMNLQRSTYSLFNTFTLVAIFSSFKENDNVSAILVASFILCRFRPLISSQTRTHFQLSTSLRQDSNNQ